MLVPENFTDFLFWFKEATEASWAKQELQSDQNIAPLNAKWVGMNESKINDIEKKYQIRFPPDYREFLKILHTVDFKPKDGQFFFNWLKNEQVVVDKLNWPYFSISQDRIWLKSWGTAPDSQDEIVNRFNKWYRDAPKLIPIFGHRYIISEPCKDGNPILSVFGSDTIIYGWNLKHYLLSEFSEDMPDELFEKIYDDEDGSWSNDYKDEIQDIFDSNWLNSSYNDIPNWGELIKQSGGSWKYQTRRK
jgi:hypothetical protein